MLEKTGEEILLGDIAPRPYQMGKRTACDYCPYRAICGFDPTLDGCTYRRLINRKDEELMEDIQQREQERDAEKKGGSNHA